MLLVTNSVHYLIAYSFVLLCTFKMIDYTPTVNSAKNVLILV